MHTVSVQVHIDAPVERVFEHVSDHEHFLQAPDGTRAKVVKEGQPDRNGLGCWREVTVGTRTRYLEEITAWERPRSFEYLIHETSNPMKHGGAKLTFTPAADGGTDVEWTTRFKVTVPVLGPLMGMVATRLFAKAFRGLLTAAKGKLEAR